MKKYLLHCATALLLLLGGASQAQAQSAVFAGADDLREAPALRQASEHYVRYQVYRLDGAALQARLAGAGVEFTPNARTVDLTLPLPQGGAVSFAVLESPVLSPALAAQNPGIKTYSGKALSGPATLRLSFSNGVFSAVLFDADKGREVYFQHVVVPGQPDAYLSYSTGDVRQRARTGPNAQKNTCGTASSPSLSTGVSGPQRRSSGGTLRTYRLAVATTTNFTAQKGIPANANTQASGLAGVVDYVNVAKGVYRRELSVDLTLVSGTNTVTTPTNNASTFVNGDDSGNLSKVQTFLDAQVGDANYDIGHVLDATLGSSSGGGVAYLGVVCSTGNKGSGVSGMNEGDATFPRVYGDQVFVHEMGHQFGMTHTFNSSIPVCTTRNAATSVEPGSGTTIMSYGYTCANAGTGTGNDDYVAAGTATGGVPLLNFHTVSLAQAIAYLATTSCGTSTSTGTTVPVLSAVTTGKTIPKSTPFTLTGTGSGGGGVLSYSWEGTDVGATSQGGTVPITEIDDETKAPFFRTYAPMSTATRTFPLLAAILDGTNKAKGDKLPSVGRTLDLRLTVRDGVGGVNESNSAITVAGNSGPFLVTSNLAGSYTGGQSQTITWSVNNTTAAPVSCALVDIVLSTDGGQTFPYTLASATANDGTQAIAMPSIPTATTTGRIQVRANGNVFFDISNVNFSLAASAVPTLTSLSPTTGPVGTSVTLTGTGLTGITGVDFNGTAATVFSTGTGTSATATVPTGAITGNVTVTTGGGTSNGLTFSVTTVSAAPTLTSLSPTTGLSGTVVTLTGTGLSGATSVHFGSAVVTTITNNTATSLTVTSPTGSGTVTVTVTTPNGTSGGVAFTYSESVNWTGVTSTDWGTASNWNPAQVPNPITTAIIGATTAPAHQPTVVGSQVADNVMLGAGATLTMAASAVLTPNGTVTLASGSTLVQAAGSELYIGGDLQNNGATLTLAPTSEVGFGITTPTVHNVLGQAVTFQNLNLAENGTTGEVLNFRTAVSVRRKLEIFQGGTVNTAASVGGSLTLLSDASGTALVVPGTGTVTGPATMQRYLTPTNPGLGYRHYSSPVSGNTLNDLTTGSYTPIFNTGYNSSATSGSVTSFPTVFGYDQSRIATAASSFTGFDKGWFSPAATDAMTTGMGYTVNIPGTEKEAFTGTLNNGNYTRTLARGADPAAGFHLVGNPYPAPLDWSAVAAADRTGLDGAMYVFESNSQYGGSYRSYTNGVGSGNPLIGSSQGFFVHVTNPSSSGTLIFRNAQRKVLYADQVPVKRGTADTRPLVQLALAGNGGSDALYLYTEAGATPGFDGAFDAAKLANTTGLNLAALTAAGEALAIDGRPAFTATTRIPLAVQVPAAGSYTLTAATLANLPAGASAVLVDNLTGARTALVAGSIYRFAMTTTTAPGRFFLNLTAAGALASATQSLSPSVTLYPNPAHGSITVLRPAGAATEGVLYSTLGQVVRHLVLPTAETVLTLHGLAPGVYTLRLTLDGQPVTKRMVVE